jgi:hypothetical protein
MPKKRQGLIELRLSGQKVPQSSQGALGNILSRKRCIQKHEAFRLPMSGIQVAFPHPAVEIVAFPLYTVAILAIPLRNSWSTLKSQFRIQIEKKGKLGHRTLDGFTIETVYEFETKFAPPTLISDAGIEKAITEHRIPTLKSGTNDFDHILSTGCQIEEKLGARIHGAALRIEQNLTNALGDGWTTRLASFMNPVPFAFQ